MEAHWHRLVKLIRWANQNIGGQNVVKRRFSIIGGGARARAAPQVYAYAWRT